MKKKLFAIIAFTLVTIFALSGCEGCVIMPELVVNNAFNGGSGETAFDPQTGYTETLKYDVKYSDEGIAPNLKDAKILNFLFLMAHIKRILRFYQPFQPKLMVQNLKAIF